MKVSVIGTGYVGIVSGACLAEKGHTVICVDNDQSKVDRMNAGDTLIHEAGLGTLIQKHIGHALTGTADLAGAVEQSDITLIAVGTPFDGERIDLTYVKNVAAEIGAALKNKRGYHVVVVKSTVVPGTTDEVVLPLLEEHSGKKAGPDFGVGMNPEFLTEGRAVFDFMNPDRIVIGGIDRPTTDALAELYAMFTEVETIVTNNKTAEMIKYASNALLATMISFANEFGNLCSSIGGVDVTDVLDGVHRSQYLTVPGPEGHGVQAPIARFLEAGCGFGGSCLPKDVKALISEGRARGVGMRLLESVIDINLGQPGQVLDILKKNFDSLSGKRVTILGLAFKPDTDDVRESPAFPIMKLLLEEGAVVSAYDPVAVDMARSAFPDDRITYHRDLQASLEAADGVVLVTRWDEFSRLPEILGRRENRPLVVDGRRMLDKNTLDRYAGIGLG